MKRFNISHIRHYSNYHTQKITVSSLLLNNRPKRHNNLLENSDYPLPGGVTCTALSPKITKNKVLKDRNVFYYTLNLLQVSNSLAFRTIKNDSYEPEAIKEVCRWSVKIELLALKCPLLLKKDLLNLFPSANLKNTQVVMINLIEIPEESSEEIEHLSDKEKADSFVLAASSICESLRNFGFWADFVDPHSNLSRLDGNSYKRLLNQSEDFKFTGVKIKEHHGCKMIEKVALKHSPFVGSVFTNAPESSDVIKRIILNTGAD